ncbi:MAG: dihydropteroate synthase [Flavobacteriaceae bacterium]|nr:dihydropteroate synthase [Flavobacteriaceae bacterium]
MTMQCKGKLIDLSRPKIMGIMNLTPDSFYDGGKNTEIKEILQKTEHMLFHGMDILDIGGQTTRPGANRISADEELSRIMPVLTEILHNFPEIIVSIDTFWSQVARETIAAGAAMINDISAGSIDEKMFDTIADLQVPYILMHMQGEPKSMQNNPEYEDVVLEVNQFFSEKIGQLKQRNINDIILDPGYGFGKTLEQNFTLLKNQKLLGFGEFPILTGISRKSMICKALNTNPINALNGTTALHMLALQNGASILRVHDVKEVAECIKLFEMYKKV